MSERRKNYVQRLDDKKFLRVLLFSLVYLAVNLAILNTGAIHPMMFVLYTTVSAVLLPGIYLAGAGRVKAPGVAVIYGGIMLIVVIFADPSWYKVTELLVMIILAELIRYLCVYDKWAGLLLSSVVMCFSNFGYSMCIWLMSDFTYSEAIAEMPTGYADKLMEVSPMWIFPVTLIATIAIAVITANISKKLLKIECN